MTKLRSWLRQLAETLVLAGVLLAGLYALGARTAAAQDGEGLALTNISGSGSASEPVVWAGPGGRFQAFWWDAFDGVTTAVYQGGRWSPPQAAVLEYPVTDQQGEVELVLTEAMASIVAGTEGWAHAIWLGPMDDETELAPLLHSAMPFGEHVWSDAHRVAEGASVWKLALAPGSRLHVVYFQAVSLGDRPPGVYHRRSVDGGLSWSEPTALAQSLHYRRTDQATSHLEIVADNLGYVLVTWNDPRTGESLWARSPDAGQNWRSAVSVSEDTTGAKDARAMLGYGGQMVMVWTGSGAAVGAGMYQSTSNDGGYTLSPAERLFSYLRLATRGMGYAWSGDNDLLVFAGSAAPTPLLLGWSPSAGWADPKYTQVAPAQASEVGLVRIDAWHAARSGGTVALVGGSQGQEIWGIIASVDLLQATARALPPIWSQPLETMVPGVQDWSEPVNLSRSGAASAGRMVGAEGGRYQAFWMDRFDGLVSSLYDGEQWFKAQSAPILARQVSGRAESGEPTTALLPLDFMPQIVGDGGQRAHAFWLVPPTESEDTRRLLMHAVLNIGEVTWGEPQQIDDAALTWRIFNNGRGGLHLVYVRSLHTPESPAGIYHTWLMEDGRWSVPLLLEPSIYARIFGPDDIILDGAADGAGNIFVSWNDSRDSGASYVLSSDGGQTWSKPLQVAVAAQSVPRVAVHGEGRFVTILNLVGADGAPALYQQYSSDGGANWTQPERVFDDGRVSLNEITFFSAGQGRLLAVTGLGSANLAMMAWDEQRSTEPGASGWSEQRRLEVAVKQSVSGQSTLLDGLLLAVNGQSLALLGQGSDGEVWVQLRSLNGLEWAFAERPPWSEASAMAAEALIDPAMASDANGDLHTLWQVLDTGGRPGSELWYARINDGRWSGARAALAAPFGFSRQPELVSIGDKLHAVWNGGQYGQVYYGQAFGRDAQTPNGWSEPKELGMVPSARGASQPNLAAGLDGSLHLVYNVPWNDRRGIYYLRSIDGGQSWSEPMAVFDAQKTDWPGATTPQLVVDRDGRLVVTFGRTNLPDGGAAEGIYATLSIDQGQTWLAPQIVDEGYAVWPQLVLSDLGQAHLVWRDAQTDSGWKHSWSSDGGHNWLNPEEVSAARGFIGQATLCSDLQGTLYWVGLVRGRAEAPTLRTLIWSATSERWQSPEDLTLSVTPVEDAAVWANLRPGLGRLDAILRAVAPSATGEQAEYLYYLARDLGGQGDAPLSMLTPVPTLTPTAGPSPTPTAEPKPTVNAQAPRMDTPVVELGPISLPLLSVVGMGVVGMIVAIILVVRLVRRRNRYGSYYYYHR